MMKEFVARENELSDLEDMYTSPNFEMLVIYGRRRVGKTALIKKFIENKPAIYFQGIEATKELNLRYLSNAIMDFVNPHRINKTAVFSDFEAAFSQIEDIANNGKEKLIFVLDEYPYLAESAPVVSSLLQYAIDHIYKQFANVMLILCGSSMSFMQHQVLGNKSPLYGRKTGQLKLEPFDIFDTKKALPNVSNDELLAYYGITGGVPQYLNFIREDKTVSENIERLFLKQTSPLQNEVNVLLQEELRKPATYYSILSAIAHGKSKTNEIYQDIGLNSSSQLSPYLNRLMELEMVERKSPILDENSKKSIYVIKDNMFKFWFKFISPAQDQIALGQTQAVLTNIMNELPRFLGPVFEQATRDWVWKTKNLPIIPREVRSWWGYNPILKRQDEIDIVAVNYNNSSALIGECKWRNPEKLTHEMITTLSKRAILFSTINKVKEYHLYFFAKQASPEFINYAKDHNTQVIEYSDFFKKA